MAGTSRACRCDAFDPGCVKTHTVAKCRKNNSPGRHHASRVQYDLTLRYAIPSRSFYARSKGWSFYTAKTHSGSQPALSVGFLRPSLLTGEQITSRNPQWGKPACRRRVGGHLR